MSKKKTHEEYEEELLEKELPCFPVEKYINARTPILHECVEGHTWKAFPNKILQGVGCKQCKNNAQYKTTAKYIEELQQRNINAIPMQEYINAKTAILHKCKKGHIWSISPDNLLRGKSCITCTNENRKGIYNEKFFEKNSQRAKLPGILYCIVLVNKKTSERVCIKIGITQGTSNRDVLKRTQGFTGYEPRIQKIVFGTLEEVYHLEQWLHETWSHRRYKSPWRFGGHTELFELDDEIIRSVPTNI